MHQVLRRGVAVAMTAAVVTALAVPAAQAAPARQRWSVAIPGATSITAPEPGAGRVYVGFTTAAGTGGIRALDATTGATLWTRGLALPIDVPPDYAPSVDLLYTATRSHVLALDPRNGKTVAIADTIETFDEIEALHFADGRLYTETRHDLAAYTPRLRLQWDYLLDDDPAPFDAPGDGFVYLNDEEDDPAAAFRQCMEKVDGARGVQVARNCNIDAFVVPVALPAANAVVGVGASSSPGSPVYAFRASNLTLRWTRPFDIFVSADATTAGGGRVAVSADHDLYLLRLTDGTTACHLHMNSATFGEPVFDPSGALLISIGAGTGGNLTKLSPACQVLWRTTASLDQVVATTGSVLGTNGTRVIALRP